MAKEAQRRNARRAAAKAINEEAVERVLKAAVAKKWRLTPKEH